MADPNQTGDPVLRSYQLPELLDYDAVAVLLSISKRTLRRLVASGALVPVYVSARRPRFPLEQVAAFRLQGIQPPTCTDSKRPA